MKYLIIIGIIGSLSLAVFLSFTLLSGDVDTDPSDELQLPINNSQQMFTPVESQELFADPEITITGVNGGNVTIANIANKTQGFSPGVGMYQFTGSQQADPRPYSLLFNANNSSFAISLDSPPFDLARSRASYDFLELLEITQQEACRLNVYVSVTAAQDPELAGQNLGLEYCN